MTAKEYKFGIVGGHPLTTIITYSDPADELTMPQVMNNMKARYAQQGAEETRYFPKES